MREISWAKIQGYEYMVSSCGYVKRISNPDKMLSIRFNNKGYAMVDLWRNGERKQFLVHRLVAEAFVSNPNHLPCVNHKDENKKNNAAENLEWCTQKYNMNYGTCGARIAKANGKPVHQFDLDGNLIKSYPSTMQAQRETGICNARISESCRGKRKKGGGYIWRYAL